MVAPVKAGDILADKYCVQRVLGVGGMGVVVAAEHIVLHQKVALKFMLPDALADEDTVQRFMREARAAVRLRSEHVARVMDVGCLENGAPYIVMEFLDGEDLDDVIQREGAMPPSVAVDYILQACMAMAEAHSIGIVHRDLKPANLFVIKRPDGSALLKVLDFGISKVQGASEASQTQSSMAMGSPGYMAPEQMRSAKHADHRADIWALGTILYQLLSNRRPYEADSTPLFFAAVLTGEKIPLGSVVADMDPALVEVVHRCLERERENRFGSVAELAQALVPFGDEKAAAMAASIGNMTVATPMAALESGADASATVPIRKERPKSEPAAASHGLPKTHVSTSEPPEPSSDFARKAQTTHRASAGQVVVAAPESDDQESAKRGPLAFVAAGLGIAAVALLATQLFSSDVDETSAAANLPAVLDPAVPAQSDAGLPDARDTATASMTTDAAPVVPKDAPQRPARPAKPRPEIKPKPEAKPKPEIKPEPVAKPKPEVKPKPEEDDPFGTMQ